MPLNVSRKSGAAVDAKTGHIYARYGAVLIAPAMPPTGLKMARLITDIVSCRPHVRRLASNRINKLGPSPT